MTNRQFSSAPVTLRVTGAPAPCLPVGRPPGPLDAGAVRAALAGTASRPRQAAQRRGRAPEFVLAQLHRTYPAQALRAALRTVAAEDSPGPATELLWQRTVDGPEALDQVLADLGRSLAAGPRLRAVLVEDAGHGSAPGGGRRLFVGIASGPPARAAGVLEELREALAHPPEPVTVPTSALQRELLRQVIGAAGPPGGTSSSCPGTGTGHWTPSASPRPGSPSSTTRRCCARPSTGTRTAPTTPGWCCTSTPPPR